MSEHIDIKDIAAEVRAKFKSEFPKCVFSVTIERYSGGRSLDVALMKAPFDVFARDSDVNGHARRTEYAQLNEYQLRREPEDFICNGSYLTPDAWAVLKRADEIANAHNWDHSESQTDYYDVNYHFSIAIGKWDKPFVKTSPESVSKSKVAPKYQVILVYQIFNSHTQTCVSNSDGQVVVWDNKDVADVVCKRLNETAQ